MSAPGNNNSSANSAPTENPGANNSLNTDEMNENRGTDGLAPNSGQSNDHRLHRVGLATDFVTPAPNLGILEPILDNVESGASGSRTAEASLPETTEALSPRIIEISPREDVTATIREFVPPSFYANWPDWSEIHGSAHNYIKSLPLVPVSNLSEEDLSCCICRKEYYRRGVTTTDTSDGMMNLLRCVPIRLPCDHIVGDKCIEQWVKEGLNRDYEGTCPLCRASIIRFNLEARPPWVLGNRVIDNY